jgi:enamine deaminase RidA (YjgF/YER057c/UK114 family)
MRQRARSGSPYEQLFGFSRAVRDGGLIHVAGTAPIRADGGCDPDPEAQADRCFEIIAQALSEVGASLDDVVRTRMFLTDAAHAEAVGRAHARAVGHAAPAATMVVAGLIDERWLVEIEADAIIRD